MEKTKGLTVLSLFDGMSCGQLALKRLGINVGSYFASEIDAPAMKVTKHNFPETVHIGDVSKVRYENGVLHTENGDIVVGKIDLLLAGSPCQGFSLVGKQLAFDDPRSALYFEFERLLKETSPKYFILENVKMKREFSDIITDRIGVTPIIINSALVSAQNRVRYYWTNIMGIQQPTDRGIRLVDILEVKVGDKYTLSDKARKYVLNPQRLKKQFTKVNGEKSATIMAGYERLNGTFIVTANGDCKDCSDSGQKTGAFTTSSWSHNNYLVEQNLNDVVVRRLTPVECERLQTVDDGYTACVADTHRYKMLGNGWTIDVICHILNQMEVK